MNYKEMVKLAQEDILDSLVDEEDFEKEAVSKWLKGGVANTGEGSPIDLIEKRRDSLIRPVAKAVNSVTGTTPPWQRRKESIQKKMLDEGGRATQNAWYAHNNGINDDVQRMKDRTIPIYAKGVKSSNIDERSYDTRALRREYENILDKLSNKGKSLADIKLGAYKRMQQRKKYGDRVGVLPGEQRMLDIKSKLAKA